MDTHYKIETITRSSFNNTVLLELISDVAIALGVNNSSVKYIVNTGVIVFDIESKTKPIDNWMTVLMDRLQHTYYDTVSKFILTLNAQEDDLCHMFTLARMPVPPQPAKDPTEKAYAHLNGMTISQYKEMNPYHDWLGRPNKNYSPPMG